MNTFTHFRFAVISLLLLLFCLCTFETFCQYRTDYALPTGYTGAELRDRNILKVHPNGNVWIGFRNIGVGVFNGTTWSVYDRTNSGLPGNNVLSIAFNGSVSWIGTDSGLVKYDGLTWTLFNTSNSGLNDNYVNRLFADGNDLWIAFRNGLQKYDGTNWVTYTTASGLANDTVQCFAKIGSFLYFGTKNGLSEFSGGAWSTFNTSNTGLLNNNIHAIQADQYGTLFIGTFGAGLNYKTNLDIRPVAAQLPIFYHPYARGYALLKAINGSVISVDAYGFNLSEYSSNPVSARLFEKHNPDMNAGNTDLTDVSLSGEIWEIDPLTGPFYKIDYLNYSNPIPLPGDYGELNMNKVKARLDNKNSLFWDPEAGEAEYEVPQGEGKTALFCQSVWIGGLDDTNKLHMSAQTYRQSGNDFWPGPLDTVTQSIDSATSAQFNKIWVVERWKIMEFMTNFNNGNVSNGTYPIPPEILTWPGNGSGNQDHYLAPFVDVDSDGIYDPQAGDYPNIKGDQMAWWVMNDTLHAHGETGGAAFGLEIQVSAYVYACPLVPDSEQVINYTTYYSYKIINRNVYSYHDVYIGLFTDVDLGNYSDDHVECNVDYDFAFGYNGDSDDEGIQGYGLNPPVISVALLKGPRADASDAVDNNHNGIIDEFGETCGMNHFMYYDNDFSDFGNPETTLDYYNYMRSIWKNGAYLTYGDNGHTGTDTCKYMFPGASDPTGIGTNGVPHSPWDEYTAANTPADRRFVMSSGPFTMAGGAVNFLEYAIVYTRELNPLNYPQSSLETNLAEVLKVRNWWATNTFPSGCALTTGIPEIKTPVHSIAIYPNPTAGEFNIYSPEFAINKVELYDVLGQRVLRVENNQRNTEPMSINISWLARGVYFVKAIGEDFTANAKLIRE
jgi:Secretion system C-terminal sorting domain/Two component regulator propeller